MVLRRLRTQDDLDHAWGQDDQTRWPLSRLFHLNSTLGSFTKRTFARNIEQFSDEERALTSSEMPVKRYPGRPTVELPPPPSRGGLALRRLLRSRRTRRRFDGKGLNISELGGLLGASSGFTAEVEDLERSGSRLHLRSWPSGGALYPLEVYWCDLGRGTDLTKGVYHYRPDIHRLERIGDLDRSEIWSLLFADNLPNETAAGALLISAVWARTQSKYGERGYRIVFLDAGHLGQNVLLVAEDLGLNAVALGGFDDLGLCQLIDVEHWEEECVVHAILLGRSPKKGRFRLRFRS